MLLPTGSTEQHGRHLPIDVDTFLVESVCLEVGRRLPEKVLVLPPISYGLNLQHMDVVNSVALRTVGVYKPMPDPEGGRIECDAQGEPTGSLRASAKLLVRRLLLQPVLVELKTALALGR